MFGVGLFARLFEKPLAEGTPAPEFTLPDQDGNAVSLGSFRGRPVVLVFYPGDDTPVCKRQLCELRDHWEFIRKSGVSVLGINPQRAESHVKFRRRYSLPFPLLVDQGQRVASSYNASGLLIKRTVYVIDANGVIRFARRGRPSSAEILAACQTRSASLKK